MLEHSRSLRLAALASGRDEHTLLEHLQRSEVCVRTDFSNKADVQTAIALIDTLRRLPIVLSIETTGMPTDLRDTLLLTSNFVDPARALQISPSRNAFTVHVGSRGAPDADMHVAAVGHGMILSVAPLDPTARSAASSLGVQCAAAFAAAEIFKHVAQVTGPRGLRHEHLAFSPVTLDQDVWTPISLPSTIPVNLALVGLGAVGTASARVLARLPINGSVALVDPERYGPENVGTYSLGGHANAAATSWKVDIAADALRARVNAIPIPGRVEDYITLIDDGKAPWPDTVLSGLDSASARRATQRIWPDKLLDGATGDTMCGLHHYRAGEQDACLICLFPVNRAGPSSVQLLANATGLDPELLRFGDQPLREEHLSRLTAEQRHAIAAHLGKPICGLARAVGLTSLPSDDYRPSVPFVSQQAACLAVGRLIASVAGIRQEAQYVQYDALAGPVHRTAEPTAATPGCYCQARSHLIAQLRLHRAGQAA